MLAIYQSQTIIIRPFQPTEFEHYYQLFEDEKVGLYLAQRSRTEHQELFNAAINSDGKTLLTRWGIFEAKTGSFIGMCLARAFEHGTGQIEIGYAIAPTYWGKGIATEVSKALVAYCFDHTLINQVVAVVDPNNLASLRVLQKAGLAPLGKLNLQGKELAYLMIQRSDI